MRELGPLPNSEVHVLFASLTAPQAQLQLFRDFLDDDELERARICPTVRSTDRFIAARGLLKSILARYIGCEARCLRLRANGYGKPELATPHAAGPVLEFNLTHSNGAAMFVLALGRKVGIDLEFMWSNAPTDRLARRFFSPRENRALNMLPADQRREAFFHLWTRREAYAKAIGHGIQFPLPPLANSQYALDPGWQVPKARDTNLWSYLRLSPAPNFASAIVVEGSDWNLRSWAIENA